MTPERWQQVAEIYQAALAQPAVARAVFVAERCGGDSSLRQEVESLLAQEQAAVVVDRRVDGVAASVLGRAPRLTPGSRVGPYAVVDLLGEGGMGQVYRARDSKLQRDVALKILPDGFVHDADRVARFTREAQVLASLNHPNIGAIYGFEDSGDVHALVLELVDGPTLADRIARGALPLDEALSIARQIAEALEAAHEHGIVHRDLKPANIKVRDDGTVKVLDFGLAKLTTADAASGAAPLLTHSPTVLSPAVTTAGVILGTAAYMSPEQAKGRPADKRSDIWAFGCVLYEMLTGRRPFDGDDVSETLAAVLKSQPDWSALPASVPNPLRQLLTACLDKDRRQRIADVAVALFVLRDSHLLASATANPSAARPPVRRSLVMALGSLALIALGAVATWTLLRNTESAKPAIVTRLEVPIDGAFSSTGRHVLTISPDGRRLAYVANNRIYLRELNALDATPVRSTETGSGGREPFFSPDGQWLGFWQEGALRKIRVVGGASEEIVKADNPFGVNWDESGVIVYGQGAEGIWRVSATGGSPERIIRMEEGNAAHGPQLLPGNRVLFTLKVAGEGFMWSDAEIVVQAVGTSDRHTILRGGTDARYLPSGHLVYASDERLYAASFDPDTLELGTPVEVVSNVALTAANTTGTAQYAVSAGGTLVHVNGSFGGIVQSVLAWVDRQGHETAIDVPPGPYQFPRISPDGSRVAVAPREREQRLMILDVQRSTLERLNTPGGRSNNPVWMPNSRELLFASSMGANADVWTQVVGSTEPARQLTRTNEAEVPMAVSSDGRTLVLFDPNAGAIKTLLIGADRDVVTVVDDDPRAIRTGGGYVARNAVLSPDDRWLAYESNVGGAGRFSIYVRSFPEGDSQVLVSPGGGTQPAWGAGGKELFYVAPAGGLVRVPVETAGGWKAGTPEPFLNGPYLWLGGGGTGLGRLYDVARDGRRFLFLKPVTDRPSLPSSVVVTQNWTEELKRLVPTP